MLKKVTEAILRFDLLKGAEHITVALSGGADSMVLLDVLLTLKNDLEIKKISAAHFNHQIRGAEALRDQDFVVKQCEKRNVKLILGTADVPQYAKQNGLSVELAARKLRYDFFDTITTDLVATAHTASDNIETVLFNITRGTALSGLCGIPPKREKFIRPLIFCTREDVENYAKQNDIAYVTDSTNLCDDYTRNKIRHNVITVLKDINPLVENAVSRMTASLREDDDFVSGVAIKEYNSRYKNNQLILDGFANLPLAVAKRVIARFCAENKIEVDSLHINQIYDICISGGKISLPQDMTAVAKNNILNIDYAKAQPTAIKFEVVFKKQDNDLFKNSQKVHSLLLKNVLDYDKIVGQLVLRTRKTGDEIRLKNKNCTKTLKKLFCEYKIPLSYRNSWPVIADDNGIVWIYKIGVADRCAVDQGSEKIYKISVDELF